MPQAVTEWRCTVPTIFSADMKNWEKSVISKAKKSIGLLRLLKLTERIICMYRACRKAAATAHDQAMHVLTSKSPEGPFGDAKQILPPFSIDSHIVKNSDGLFLFYSINDYESKMGGTYIVVDRMLDPYTPEGKPVSVIRPTLPEELREKQRFSPDKDWYTVEGAFYIRKGDWHYVLYSGNCFENQYYFVGYAYAHTPENDLTKIKFQKYPADNVYKPLLAKNDFEEGTGHNSVIEYNGEYYAVYHARDWGKMSENYTECRTARHLQTAHRQGDHHRREV